MSHFHTKAWDGHGFIEIHHICNALIFSCPISCSTDIVKFLNLLTYILLLYERYNILLKYELINPFYLLFFNTYYAFTGL